MKFGKDKRDDVVSIEKWQQEVVADVMARLRATGASVALPGRMSLESVFQKALVGVFDRMQELIHAAESALTRASAAVAADDNGGKDVRSIARVRNEQEWLEFLRECYVTVKDPEVGKQIMRGALESSDDFVGLIGAIAKYKSLTVPLLSYPGVKLFTGGGSPVSGSRQRKEV